jgi:hypothetical protein
MEVRFSMDTAQHGSTLIERLAKIISWLTNGSWQILPTKEVDDLYAEISHLERTLANAPTRPTLLRKSRPLEPVTERHKIMDLAG